MTVPGPSAMGSAMVGGEATGSSNTRWGFSWARSKASTSARSAGLPAQARSRNADRSLPNGISIAERKIDFSASSTMENSLADRPVKDNAKSARKRGQKKRANSTG